MKKKKVVVLGGGNGVAKTTRALKRHTDIFNISSVVAMSDSGGSSGVFRKKFKVLPPGDILRAALALSSCYPYKILKKMFRTVRFKGVGKLSNHNLGNLFLVLSNQYDGKLINAVRALEQAVEAVGHTYPATMDNTHLIAQLSNGKVIKTEGRIDRPDYNRKNRIEKVWLDPDGKIHKDAKKEIESADYLVLGPGSLYCSIVASLLPKGVKSAIKKSKAKIIYLAGNTYELNGETGPSVLSEYVEELEMYLPRKIDHVVYNKAKLTVEQVRKHKQRKWGVKKLDKENLKDCDLIIADYEKSYGGLCETKLGKIIRKIVLKK